MPQITIPHFHGGESQSPYEPLSTGAFQSARNLDTYVDGNLLRPVKLAFNSVALPTISNGTSIKVSNTYLASNGKYYFAGSAVISSTLTFVLWSTPTLEPNPTYSVEYSASTGTPTDLLEEYKDGLYFGWGTNLDKWANLSGTPSRSNIGTVTTSITHLRSHRGLGLLFFAHASGTKIGKWDNSSFTAAALTLDVDDVIVGMEEYQRWLIVGVRGVGSKRSRFLIWDGSSTTVDDIINIGDVGLQGFRIINGVIRYVSITNNSQNDYLRLATVVPGGRPRIIFEKQVNLTAGSNQLLTNAFSSFGDIFFYGLNGSAYSNLDLGIFAHGSPSDGVAPFSQLWRLVASDITTGICITSIKHNGSSFLMTWSTTTNGGGTQHIETITGNGITFTSPSSGYYKSNIFPINNGKMGNIKSIEMYHNPIPTGCGFTVKIKHYGHYDVGADVPSADTFTTIPTRWGNTATKGFTQSTDGAIYTILEGDQFKEARFAQLEIYWDEVPSNNTNAAEILFPIIINT